VYIHAGRVWSDLYFFALFFSSFSAALHSYYRSIGFYRLFLVGRINRFAETTHFAVQQSLQWQMCF
jgi:hypothetical protein